MYANTKTDIKSLVSKFDKSGNEQLIKSLKSKEKAIQDNKTINK